MTGSDLALARLGDDSRMQDTWDMKAGMLAERARIESEARRLAWSGEYGGWRSIERALLAQSRFTQVPYIFANLWTRSELDRLCREARLRRKEPLRSY